MRAALALAERELDARNVLWTGRARRDADALAALLAYGRRPRVAAVGRRGAGKSSLLNALAHGDRSAVGDVADTTSEVRAHELTLAGHAVEWLDTPGLRAGGRGDRARVLAEALVARPPDVLLFLCAASEVDAGIDDDLADWVALYRAVRGAAIRGPAVFALATRSDELAPPDVVLPPFDDAEKRANIRASVSLLRARTQRAGLAPLGVLPIAAYVRYPRRGVPERLAWNLDALAARVSSALPPRATLARVDAPRELQAALRGVMSALIDAFASSGRLATAREFSVLEGLLRALAPRADVATSPGLLDALRGGVAWLRGGESMVRARGAALVGALLAREDDAYSAILRERASDGSR